MSCIHGRRCHLKSCERAQKAAAHALDRSGYDPESDNPEYPQIAWNRAVIVLADQLDSQRESPLPEYRNTPITAPELRRRLRNARWWRACDEDDRRRRERPADYVVRESNDDIPF